MISGKTRDRKYADTSILFILKASTWVGLWTDTSLECVCKPEAIISDRISRLYLLSLTTSLNSKIGVQEWSEIQWVTRAETGEGEIGDMTGD